MPLRLVDHPIAHQALFQLRDTGTEPAAFRAAAQRISLLLAAEALRDVPTRETTVQSPLDTAAARVVSAGIVLVPVLRAGLGMLESVLSLVPDARVGHIGLQRDEHTAAAANYYARLPPDISGRVVLLLDPMLATGGSASAALDHIKAAGATRISMVCIVAAPEGLALLDERHPDVPVFTPVVDRQLNARKFIVPGLGDFGDRLYGT